MSGFPAMPTSSPLSLSPPNAANVKPVLDEATRSFVRRALGAGLVEMDDLKKVVVSLMQESDRFSPKRLAEGLMGAGILTKWQANKLLLGRSKGFHLGSYRLLRPIGKGGMGMVYLGEHHVMKRSMALKILPPEATNNTPGDWLDSKKKQEHVPTWIIPTSFAFTILRKLAVDITL